jgi:hypothetical protein
MNDDDKPTPGSPEYDAMMAAKYRQQGSEQPLTADGQKAKSTRTVEHPNGTVEVHEGSSLKPQGEPETFTAAQADPAQVLQLEREIERLRAEIEEVDRYDPTTGEPVYRLSAEQQRLRGMRLAHLEQVVLPATREMVAKAQAWRTENVEPPLHALIRERDERDAKRQRAQEIADEMEAQAEAKRILRGRGGLGIG